MPHSNAQCSAVLLLTLLLAACNSPASSPSGAAPDTTSATRSPTAGTQVAENRLPLAAHGTYDADAAACAERLTMTRLVVSADTLEFYYGYATVDSVVARAGGYDVGATLYQLEGAVEVVPEPAAYRLDPRGDGFRDGLQIDHTGASVPGQSLVRCPAPGTHPGGATDSGEGEDADSENTWSEYTEIEHCQTIESFEESGGAVQRCPGYGGTPLYVSEGDLRYDVDAGVRNDAWETPGGFNALGRTVEWRIREGRAFAVIVRYQVEGPSGTARDRRSDLAVIKVGRPGAPGCLVGYVPADAAPDQNTAARHLADREAAEFACDSS